MCVYWLGTGELSFEQKRQVDSYKLNGRFFYLSGDDIGPNRSDLLSLIKVADLFVLPSLEEGLPVALIEAMALAKACISTETGAIPEAIAQGRTGWLVHPATVRSWLRR